MNPFSSQSHSYHPPPDFDEPPAYSYGDSTYMAESESPTGPGRQNGATMRLLPTSANEDHLEGDLRRESEDLGYVSSLYFLLVGML